MNATYKPQGYTSVAPYLIVSDASGTIDFLVRAFDGVELLRFPAPNGKLMHAEVRLDDTVVMLGDASEGWPAVGAHVHFYVPDVDAAYRRALQAGATSVQEPVRKNDPDKRAGVKDVADNLVDFHEGRLVPINPALVTTTFELPGHRATKNFGVVRGIVVRSRSIVGTIGASLQTLVGGNITLYTELCEKARADAFKLMLEHAAETGANALIGVRYDANEIAPGVTEVLAYGTAVRVEQVEG